MATQKTVLIDLLLSKFANNEFKYSDIVKTLVEDIWGRNYNWKIHRGVSSANLGDKGYLRRGSRVESRYLYLDNNSKIWSVKGV